MCWVCVRAQAEVSFKNVKKFFKNTRATENADPAVKPRASLCLSPLHMKHNLTTNYFTLGSDDVTPRCHLTPNIDQPAPLAKVQTAPICNCQIPAKMADFKE